MGKQSASRTKKIIYSLAIIMGLALLATLASSIATSKHRSYVGDGFSMIETGWFDSEGNPMLLSELKNSKNETVIYHDFDKRDHGNVLIFTARNCYVDVYENGNLLDEDQWVNSILFGTSPGTRWHMVDLEHSDSAMIELHCTPCYKDAGGYISNIYLGKSDEVVKHINSIIIPSYTLNAVWIFLSLMLVAIYFLFKDYFKLEKDVLFLALGSLASSAWCGAESKAWQFMYGHSENVHLVSYLCLILLPIFFGNLFLNRLDGKWQAASKIYVKVSTIIAAWICVLQIFGLVEFHYSVRITRILLVLLMPFATKVIIDYSKNEAVIHLEKLLLAGYGVLVVLMAVGISRYRLGYYNDYVIFFDGALFCLMAIFLMYQMAGINEVMRKGLQSELLRDLAMMDHLTKFYNRTGYADHKEEYEKAETPLGVVQFDVNDLKKVNDSQGHEKGDELLCLAASGIAESFGLYGRCYRMGGDEFLAVLNCSDPVDKFNAAIANLANYCDSVNQDNVGFQLHIAYGFALKQPGEAMSVAVEKADTLMYSKKKEMKANR